MQVRKVAAQTDANKKMCKTDEKKIERCVQCVHFGVHCVWKYIQRRKNISNNNSSNIEARKKRK